MRGIDLAPPDKPDVSPPRPAGRGILILAIALTLALGANYIREAFGLWGVFITGTGGYYVLGLAYAYFVILLAIALSTRVSASDFLFHVLLSGTFTIFACAYVFVETGLTFDGAGVHDHWTSLYFSIVAFSTLGFGDVTPQATARFPAAAEAMAGNLHLALVAASVFFLLSKRSESSVKDAVSSFRQEITDLTGNKTELEEAIGALEQQREALEKEIENNKKEAEGDPL